jgi:hypothetical protein
LWLLTAYLIGVWACTRRAKATSSVSWGIHDEREFYESILSKLAAQRVFSHTTPVSFADIKSMRYCQE